VDEQRRRRCPDHGQDVDAAQPDVGGVQAPPHARQQAAKARQHHKVAEHHVGKVRAAQARVLVPRVGEGWVQPVWGARDGSVAGGRGVNAWKGARGARGARAGRARTAGADEARALPGARPRQQPLPGPAPAGAHFESIISSGSRAGSIAAARLLGAGAGLRSRGAGLASVGGCRAGTPACGRGRAAHRPPACVRARAQRHGCRRRLRATRAPPAALRARARRPARPAATSGTHSRRADRGGRGAGGPLDRAKPGIGAVPRPAGTPPRRTWRRGRTGLASGCGSRAAGGELRSRASGRGRAGRAGEEEGTDVGNGPLVHCNPNEPPGGRRSMSQARWAGAFRRPPAAGAPDPPQDASIEPGSTQGSAQVSRMARTAAGCPRRRLPRGQRGHAAAVPPRRTAAPQGPRRWPGLQGAPQRRRGARCRPPAG
jgi:hypothetical protein